MQIDPLKQEATVAAQQATEQQLKAVYQYSETDLVRQSQLYKDGIISKQAYDQAMQAFPELEGCAGFGFGTDQDAARAACVLPDSGAVRRHCGRHPVHLGDYVSSTTTLTTVDEAKDLEAYIYVPTERAAEARTGLAVDLLDASGAVLAHTSLDFVSPEVDNNLQGILVRRRFRGLRSNCAMADIERADYVEHGADAYRAGACGDAHRR